MSKKDEILEEAEARVRIGGYSNVSFRDLAAAVGIKSASVHYHFPTKIDLGVALAKRYTDNFMNALGDAKALIDQGHDPFKRFVDLFRNALVVDEKMCLCGMLGAELDGLPEEVQAATRVFFQKNIVWLTNAHQYQFDSDAQVAKTHALKLIAELEGALLISRTLDDASVFESIVAKDGG